MQQVLQALLAVELQVNPTKSRLGFTELKYLGFLVGEGCLRPLPDKVEALTQQTQPITKRQLRWFLGLVRYHSWFIPGFASIASPLTDALQKAAPTQVRWGPSEERAFEQSCTSLQRTMVLHNLDFAKPFVVPMDASGTSIGAFLSQEVEGTECPILFISRKLQPAKRKYSMVEKEALAVKWAMGSLQYYLSSSPFKLVVDHTPLLWIMSMKDHNPRLLRWYVSLLRFHFTVRHQAGKDHQIVDYLSRMFEEGVSTGKRGASHTAGWGRTPGATGRLWPRCGEGTPHPGGAGPLPEAPTSPQTPNSPSLAAEEQRHRGAPWPLMVTKKLRRPRDGRGKRLQLQEEAKRRRTALGRRGAPEEECCRQVAAAINPRRDTGPAVQVAASQPQLAEEASWGPGEVEVAVKP